MSAERDEDKTKGINMTREEMVVTHGQKYGGDMEFSEFEVTVAGVKRMVKVERWSSAHGWTISDAAVMVRFPTGSKEHYIKMAGLVARGDGWAVAVHGFRNCNRCYVTRWATDADAEAAKGWTGKRKQKSSQ